MRTPNIMAKTSARVVVGKLRRPSPIGWLIMGFKDAKRCKAKAKRTGERCKNAAVKGYDVCRMHGANPKNRGGPPKKNLNTLVHGCFVDRFLRPGEEEMFNQSSKHLARAKCKWCSRGGAGVKSSGEVVMTLLAGWQD